MHTKTYLLYLQKKKYQKDKGNLSHTHLMLKVNWDKLSNTEKLFIDDIFGSSVVDTSRVDEVDKIVEQGLIDPVVALDDSVEDGSNISNHQTGAIQSQRLSCILPLGDYHILMG